MNKKMLPPGRLRGVFDREHLRQQSKALRRGHNLQAGHHQPLQRRDGRQAHGLEQHFRCSRIDVGLLHFWRALAAQDHHRRRSILRHAGKSEARQPVCVHPANLPPTANEPLPTRLPRQSWRVFPQRGAGSAALSPPRPLFATRPPQRALGKRPQQTEACCRAGRAAGGCALAEPRIEPAGAAASAGRPLRRRPWSHP